MKTFGHLAKAAHNAHALEHRYVQLVIHRKRRPSNWDRVRIFPGVYGLYGRCVGETTPGSYMIDVSINDIFVAENRQAARSGSVDR